jgi:hypothetical protein
MNAPTRGRLHGLAALLAACLLLALPAAALAAGAATPTYTKETRAEYEKQLNSHEIKAAVFNKKLRNLHIKTKNGELFLYHYGKKESAKLAGVLKTDGVTVSFLKPSAAAAEASTATKPAHKLRYIAGGLVVVALVIVGIVLLVNRRRAANE